MKIFYWQIQYTPVVLNHAYTLESSEKLYIIKVLVPSLRNSYLIVLDQVLDISVF